jgi:hypothetical protein
MRPSPDEAGKEDKAHNSANPGKVRQNPQPPRNQFPPNRNDDDKPNGGEA